MNDWAIGGLGAARAVDYMGTALLVGGTFFIAFTRHRPRTSTRIRLVGAVAIAVGGLVAILLQGPFRDVLATNSGHATGVRVGLAVVAALALPATAVLGRWGRFLELCLVVLVVATYPLGGHPAVARPGHLAMLSDGAHVAAMALWLGGVVMVLACVRELGDDDAREVVRTFGVVAPACIAVLALTGTWHAWRQTGAWGAVTGTTYGRELLVKTALVMVVLAVATVSRAWLLGRIRVVRKALLAEVVLGVAILVVTAMLVAGPSGRAEWETQAPPPDRSGQSDGGAAGRAASVR